MKKYSIACTASLLLVLCTLLSGCQAIGDIFKAGVWTGIIIVVAVIGLIIFIIAKASGGKS